jgi:hypothetical protein
MACVVCGLVPKGKIPEGSKHLPLPYNLTTNKLTTNNLTTNNLTTNNVDLTTNNLTFIYLPPPQPHVYLPPQLVGALEPFIISSHSYFQPVRASSAGLISKTKMAPHGTNTSAHSESDNDNSANQSGDSSGRGGRGPRGTGSASLMNQPRTKTDEEMPDQFFSYFTKLPIELRRKIWGLFILPGILRIEHEMVDASDLSESLEYVDVTCRQPIHFLLHVNKESRSLYLEKHPRVDILRANGTLVRGYFVDFNTDIVFVDPSFSYANGPFEVLSEMIEFPSGWNKNAKRLALHARSYLDPRYPEDDKKRFGWWDDENPSIYNFYGGDHASGSCWKEVMVHFPQLKELIVVLDFVGSCQHKSYVKMELEMDLVDEWEKIWPDHDVIDYIERDLQTAKDKGLARKDLVVKFKRTKHWFAGMEERINRSICPSWPKWERCANHAAHLQRIESLLRMGPSGVGSHIDCISRRDEARKQLARFLYPNHTE